MDTTGKQISKELQSMYQRMRDPKEHDKAEQKERNKKRVNNTIKRYGL